MEAGQQAANAVNTPPALSIGCPVCRIPRYEEIINVCCCFCGFPSCSTKGCFVCMERPYQADLSTMLFFAGAFNTFIHRHLSVVRVCGCAFLLGKCGCAERKRQEMRRVLPLQKISRSLLRNSLDPVRTAALKTFFVQVSLCWENVPPVFFTISTKQMWLSWCEW